MDEVIIETIQELESILSKYGDGFLYRGQTGHYLDSNGDVNIPTSFSRHGCVPAVMFKWAHYSKVILRAFTKINYHDASVELSQAVLQHYGWRSFYVDLSKSASIACWFASHVYKEDRHIYMCENIEEDPVWLVHRKAEYTPSNSNGHIYIIDASNLINLGGEIHDLTILPCEEGTLRFHAQSACLAGNLQGKLPPQCITTHLEIKNEVLHEFCNKNNLNQTSQIFPSPDTDFVLDALLQLPWQKIPIDGPIPAYRRSLELPDYDAEFVKRLPPSIALFDDFWIAEQRNEFDGSLFQSIPFYKLPELSYFANTNDPFDLHEVNELLLRHDKFAIELNGLIKVPELRVEYEYEKGIFVEKIDTNVVTVSGLIVEHPSHLVSGVGVIKGWYYEIRNNVWHRIEHADECPCNNALRHELQFSLLRMLNESLKEKHFVEESALTFRHKDIVEK